MKRLLLSSLAVFALAIPAQAAECPTVTVADPMGVAAGAFPQQYELAEFEAAADCTLTFQENPAIGGLNDRIRGNPALPPLAERLPEEPLVVAPYEMIGRYGGTDHKSPPRRRIHYIIHRLASGSRLREIWMYICREPDL